MWRDSIILVWGDSIILIWRDGIILIWGDGIILIWRDGIIWEYSIILIWSDIIELNWRDGIVLSWKGADDLIWDDVADYCGRDVRNGRGQEMGGNVGGDRERVGRNGRRLGIILRFGGSVPAWQRVRCQCHRCARKQIGRSFVEMFDEWDMERVEDLSRSRIP